RGRGMGRRCGMSYGNGMGHGRGRCRNLTWLQSPNQSDKDFLSEKKAFFQSKIEAIDQQLEEL
ncbi:MAG TPA: DUF5320 domain-containing protein, partial [Clostridiaceae bacterium]|nr:DUF5320 domain-containing protein [Clostridiaceae bacterium]